MTIGPALRDTDQRTAWAVLPFKTTLCSVDAAAPFQGHTDHPDWCRDYLRTPSTSNTNTDKLENHSKGISDSQLKTPQPQLQPQKETGSEEPLQHTLQTGRTVTHCNIWGVTRMTCLGNLVSVYISCHILSQILTWNYQHLRPFWKRA